MPRVTLSYRRDDSSAAARAIYDRLRSRYGVDSVFMDIDAIEFGEDYRKRIHSALRETDYLLVLIGPRWVGPLATGRNRIADTNDPVRMEVERALEIGLKVVPILLEHTMMPNPDDLPESLRELPFLNAADISTGREFDSQMERIIRFIDRTFTETEARRTREQIEQKEDLIAGGILTEAVAAPISTPPPPPIDATTPPPESVPVVEAPPIVPRASRSVPGPAIPETTTLRTRDLLIGLGALVIAGLAFLLWQHRPETPAVAIATPSAAAVIAKPQPTHRPAPKPTHRPTPKPTHAPTAAPATPQPETPKPAAPHIVVQKPLAVPTPRIVYVHVPAAAAPAPARTEALLGSSPQLRDPNNPLIGWWTQVGMAHPTIYVFEANGVATWHDDTGAHNSGTWTGTGPWTVNWQRSTDPVTFTVNADGMTASEKGFPLNRVTQ